MRVTLTGIDDYTNISTLRWLIAEYPFVEFGVLFSVSRRGQQRYPSDHVRRQFAVELGQNHLSLHLCGRAARETMSGSEEWVHSKFAAGYGRIQINGYVPSADMKIGRLAFDDSPTPGKFRYILQARNEVDVETVAADARVYRGADVLFDPSSGQGLKSLHWPSKPSGIRFGYAGGIGPENINTVLADLWPLNPDWIDMESSVRDEHGEFCVGRARQVLDACYNYFRSIEMRK